MNKKEHFDILAFGAHPDDVELGCGGSLFKLHKLGYRTAIVDLTEGEIGSRGNVEQRYQESARAAEILQAGSRRNLRIPDGHIQVNDFYREKIIRTIRELQPRLVFAPYPDDRHPDHIHAGNLITEGAFYAGVRKVLPEVPPHRPFRILYYMAKYEFTPSFVIDISSEYETKFKALQAYQSQFYNPEWPEEQTFISSRWFMESVEFRARHFGWMAGVKYAEPFWIREPLALDDPVPVFSRSIT
ncbi:MAG: bacillithiol biosynthesis deacetylase BshB1 [Calditrichia bacterium]